MNGRVVIRIADLVGWLPRRSPRRANRCNKNRAIRKRTNNSHGKGKEPTIDGRTKEQSEDDLEMRNVRDLDERHKSSRETQTQKELRIHLEFSEND